MVKTWSDDNPKAALMTRKRALIVQAAECAFLESGYAESSVNRIAAAAGVSIKTLYRHFQSKDELFSAVMQATCKSFGEGPDGETVEPDWFGQPPEFGLPVAGVEFLRHTLSQEQLSLYRVLTRDAVRFPELARRYQDEVVTVRNALFAAYLDRWLPSTEWAVADKAGASSVFEALLKAGLFDEVLHGLTTPTDEDLIKRGRVAAAQFLYLLKAGQAAARTTPGTGLA